MIPQDILSITIIDLKRGSETKVFKGAYLALDSHQRRSKSAGYARHRDTPLRTCSSTSNYRPTLPYFSSLISTRQLNQLYFIPIRIFHKSNHRLTMFHRSWFASHLSPTSLNLLTSRVDILNTKSNVTVSIS